LFTAGVYNGRNASLEDVKGKPLPQWMPWPAEKETPRPAPRESAAGQCPDELLVECTLLGEEWAYNALMGRYLPIVLGFLHGKTYHEADIEDMAQDIFLKAYRNLNQLRSRNRFGPWLMRIARSRLLDYYRTASRRPREVVAEPDHPGPLDRAFEPAPGPRRQAGLAQVRDVVLDEIEALAEKYRTVVYLRIVGEETTADIARRLGLRECTVRMRLYRGLKSLRSALRRHGIGPGSGEGL
jgi:RNA polymerase sigma-70 factor, ECF subfamily